jgi:hypothetical protein
MLILWLIITRNSIAFEKYSDLAEESFDGCHFMADGVLKELTSDIKWSSSRDMNLIESCIHPSSRNEGILQQHNLKIAE